MSKHLARHQVFEAVRTVSGPDTSEIHSALIASHAMMYRPERDVWEGSFSILDIHGEDCTLPLPPPSAISRFRTIVDKRDFSEDQNFAESVTEIHNTPDEVQSNHVSSAQDRNNSRSSDADLSHLPPSNANMVSSKTSNGFTKNFKLLTRFESSRMKQINGLTERGVCKVADKSQTQGLHVFGSRSVDSVKKEGTADVFRI